MTSTGLHSVGGSTSCWRTNCCSRAWKVMVLVILTLLLLQYAVNLFLYKKYHFSTIIAMEWFSSQESSSSTQPAEEFKDIRQFLESGVFRDQSQPGKGVNSTIIGSAGAETSNKEIGNFLSSTGNSSIAVRNDSTVPVRTERPACPLIPAGLKGTVSVVKEAKNWTEIQNEIINLEPGGLWRPPSCTARHRVAIVIPYRDRDMHLRVFLRHMHPFLQKQQLDYGIFVVELAEPTKFNRAMLMNIGFAEALKLYDYQCFVFHDVDLLPEDDRNIYSCPEQPRHMSVAIDKFHYKLPYEAIFGGVTALSKEQFNKVNGYSNKFFGWGGEDDDMHNRIVARKLHITRYPVDIARYRTLTHVKEKPSAQRITARGYKIIRYPLEISRYIMLSHVDDSPNPERMKLLYSGKKRWDSEGLNSLKYKILKAEQRKLYTWIYVEIDKASVETT